MHDDRRCPSSMTAPLTAASRPRQFGELIAVPRREGGDLAHRPTMESGGSCPVGRRLRADRLDPAKSAHGCRRRRCPVLQSRARERPDLVPERCACRESSGEIPSAAALPSPTPPWPADVNRPHRRGGVARATQDSGPSRIFHRFARRIAQTTRKSDAVSAECQAFSPWAGKKFIPGQEAMLPDWAARRGVWLRSKVFRR